jgi:uncharacterized protein (DUF1786 family)
VINERQESEMRLLAIDIGGYTQDILLFDSSQPIENCFKMVMPSPTTMLAKKIKEATKAKHPIFLTGVNMGGGPSKKALENYLLAGGRAYATVGAATSFDDDVEQIAKLGVSIIPDNKRPSIKNLEVFKTNDLDLPRIEGILEAFGIGTDLDGIAVAVFDHGAAPPGMSDRKFRFQHLQQVVSARKELIAFAYLASEIPPQMTRMKAVAQSTNKRIPLLVMDTPVAAAIGSLEDRAVSRHHRKIVMNVGNFHTLAFHLDGNTILGFFEHHTRKLTTTKTDKLLTRFIRGELSNEEVFNDDGHGCLVIEARQKVPFVSVTGPKRALMSGSQLKPYFATPYGDMMLTGCFGLIRAFALRIEKWRDEIDGSLINPR